MLFSIFCAHGKQRRVVLRCREGVLSILSVVLVSPHLAIRVVSQLEPPGQEEVGCQLDRVGMLPQVDQVVGGPTCIVPLVCCTGSVL